MPHFPLTEEEIAELEKLHKLSPSKTHTIDYEFDGESSVEVQVESLEASAFYQAAREMVPYLIEEIRRSRKS